jgi:thioesterase domain-containing protein
LVPIQTSGSKPPFFFVHAHGGNVIGYSDLARHLGPDQPFYGVQAQNLNGRQVAARRIEDMAAHYIEEMTTVLPRGPYYLGGWCMGGIIALEMAQQLRSQGKEVALLAMVQSTHPDYPRFLPKTSGLHRLLYRLVAGVDREVSSLVEKPPNERLPHGWKRVKRGMTIVQVQVESVFAKLHLRIPRSRAYTLDALQKAHNMAYENYEPRPYEGPVALFRVSKQPLGIYSDPTLGWGQLMKGSWELYKVPGYRLGILQEPRVQILAEQLRICLDKARVSRE